MTSASGRSRTVGFLTKAFLMPATEYPLCCSLTLRQHLGIPAPPLQLLRKQVSPVLPVLRQDLRPLKILSSSTKACKRRSLRLSINEAVIGDNFTKARGQVLIDACIAWNTLDASTKYRIKLPATTGSCPDYQLANGEVAECSAGEGSGTESTAGSAEEEAEDESEGRGF